MVRIEVGDMVFYANEKAYNMYKELTEQKEKEFIEECVKFFKYESLS